jgi:hypothetical protein
MTIKKFVRIVLLLAVATAITILVNIRFPKYGNTNTDIAHFASRRAWYETLVFGTDVSVYAMKDIDDYRVAVVVPLDEEDQQFGYVYFKRNSSGDYEQRGEIKWSSADQMMVLRLETENDTYDVALYRNNSVVLIQRETISGSLENLQVSNGNAIVPWISEKYRYTYTCVTSKGEKLSQAK